MVPMRWWRSSLKTLKAGHCDASTEPSSNLMGLGGQPAVLVAEPGVLRTRNGRTHGRTSAAGAGRDSLLLAAGSTATRWPASS